MAPPDDEPGDFGAKQATEGSGYKSPAKLEDPPEKNEQGLLEEGADEKEELPMLGGTIEQKAYCLLDGIFEVRSNSFALFVYVAISVTLKIWSLTHPCNHEFIVDK